ncbi:hypothetical protein EVA_11822 [gut metagenome]|uniref:Uncharacterized protein n=1 Tax=gut metagenome TaxID=749906 RepID=J9GKA2_9ZZZZ
MHGQLPKIIQRNVQQQTQLHTHNTAMGHNSNVFIMSLLCENLLKSSLAAFSYLGKGFTIRRHPFAGPCQEKIHFLWPAFVDVVVFQAFPIAKAHFLQ